MLTILYKEIVMLQLVLRSRQQFTSSQLQKRVCSILTKTKDKKIRDLMGKFNEQLVSISLNFGEESVGFVKFVKKPDTLHHNFTIFQKMRPVQLLHKFVYMRQRALEEMQLCRLEAINISKIKVRNSAQSHVNSASSLFVVLNMIQSFVTGIGCQRGLIGIYIKALAILGHRNIIRINRRKVELSAYLGVNQLIAVQRLNGQDQSFRMCKLKLAAKSQAQRQQQFNNAVSTSRSLLPRLQQLLPLKWKLAANLLTNGLNSTRPSRRSRNQQQSIDKIQRNLQLVEERIQVLSRLIAQDAPSNASSSRPLSKTYSSAVTAGSSSKRIQQSNTPQSPSAIVSQQQSLQSNQKFQLPTGIDKKLAHMILDEMLVIKPNVSWDDIAGLQAAKQQLQELVILPALRQDLFQGLRSPAKGLLLFGPAGTGKTLLAKAVAHESNSKFFSISSSSLTSKWLGESEKLVRTMFLLARHLQPSIIFIDEIDSILGQRQSASSSGGGGGGATDPNDRVVLIAATNRPQDLDEAVRRRFTKRLYIPLPEAETRSQLLKQLLDKHKRHSVSASQLNAIVKKTEGYSCSDLNALAKEAALYPLREISLARLKLIKPEEIRNITAQDLIQAMDVIRPSVSSQDLTELSRWSQSFGSSGQ
ncbi:hypothetical protein MIR68_009753 [Amoeboaphelidium protococcarum]|nr:hypothetical protein MIR68_009753 [Amoeboaphelidium protococcarum]